MTSKVTSSVTDVQFFDIDIPNEITILFFRFLPGKQLGVTAQVCRTWKKLIYTTAEFQKLLFLNFCHFANIPYCFFPKMFQGQNSSSPTNDDQVLVMLQNGAYEKDIQLLEHGRNGLKFLNLIIKLGILKKIALKEDIFEWGFELAKEVLSKEEFDKFFLKNLTAIDTKKLEKIFLKRPLETSLEIALFLQLPNIFKIVVARFNQLNRLKEASEIIKSRLSSSYSKLSAEFLLEIVRIHNAVGEKEEAKKVSSHINDAAYKAFALAEIGEVSSLILDGNTLLRVADIMAAKGDIQAVEEMISKLPETQNSQELLRPYPKSHLIAKALAVSKGFKDALTYAENIKDDEKFACFLEIATLQIARGDKEGAKDSLRRIPKNTDPYLIFGFDVTNQIGEKLQDALKKTNYLDEIEKLISFFKSSISLFYPLVKYYLDTGHEEIALKLMKYMDKSNRYHFYFLKFNTRVVKRLIKAKKTDEALKYVKELQEPMLNLPIKGKLFHLVIEEYARLGLEKQTFEVLNLMNDSSSAINEKVKVLISNSKFLEAKKTLQNAARNYPELSLEEIKYQMGKSYLSKLQ